MYFVSRTFRLDIEKGTVAPNRRGRPNTYMYLSGGGAAQVRRVTIAVSARLVRSAALGTKTRTRRPGGISGPRLRDAREMERRLRRNSAARRGRERRRAKRRPGGERGGRPRFSYTLLSALTNLNSRSPDNGLALVKRASALMARIRLKWERLASKASRRSRGRRRRRRRRGHGRSELNYR